ncbi:hypothetical protein NTG1052_280004 [Candidatus Nitrotoga sp. 1052]|nr:hypothetical protein NTG1052_280004 [Candidatus Nitrotoga sp. 1052]
MKIRHWPVNSYPIPDDEIQNDKSYYLMSNSVGSVGFFQFSIGRSFGSDSKITYHLNLQKVHFKDEPPMNKKVALLRK